MARCKRQCKRVSTVPDTALEYFTLFSRVCTTTPHLSSAKACTITMESGTSPHVLRFTDFDHRRERRRLEYAFLTNAAATVRSVWERCE